MQYLRRYMGDEFAELTKFSGQLFSWLFLFGGENAGRVSAGMEKGSDENLHLPPSQGLSQSLRPFEAAIRNLRAFSLINPSASF